MYHLPAPSLINVYESYWAGMENAEPRFPFSIVSAALGVTLTVPEVYRLITYSLPAFAVVRGKVYV